MNMLSFAQYHKYLREDSAAALRYAVKAHAGQFRSDGKTPYIKHPERVAEFVRKFKKSKNLDALISAAFLHDTLEDTDTTHEDLEKMFGALVASLVKELTSDKDKIKEVGKTDYLAQKMATMSSWALVIKLADRLDNVQDIATAKTPSWRQKYKTETESILTRLEKDRSLSRTHQKIIAAIRKKLQEVK
jgi:guanosine-3',5'-bis(diphosphate) 3'-pyrophosphohydrolase